MKYNKLTYLTYQSFPANTANSLQTIKNLESISKLGINTELIFPLREKISSDSIKTINNFYNTNVEINVTGVKHNYPFGKIKFFEKYLYHISHYLWAKKAVNKIAKNYETNAVFMTRSDWVFHFLIKKNFKVVFECHQTSKLRNFILNKHIEKENSRIIFLNELLKNHYIKNKKNCKYVVLHNGVNLDEFNNFVEKKKQLVFVGNLLRFDKSRNLEFFIKGFVNSQLAREYILIFVGGPKSEAERLKNFVRKSNFNCKIEFTGKLKRKEVIHTMQQSMFGILINSSENQHSYLYTSPIKYFEYIAAELKVIAVDFPSHRNLPLNKKISYFEENNSISLINCLNNLNINSNLVEPSELYEISLRHRAEKIIELLND